jgi:ADP-ribose pyrophosphatase YjhB (NUDIX family)
MYKVFFNDRRVFLTDDFAKNFQVKDGLFYKYRNKKELKDLLDLYRRLNLIDTLYLVHQDIEKLRKAFRSCYLIIEAAGGLVRNNQSQVLVINRRNKWDLPKGKLEINESIRDAAVREVHEECGISGLQIRSQLLSTYHTYMIKDKMILKKTYWFEMFYGNNETPVPQEIEDIHQVRWFVPNELDEVLENTYGSVIDVLRYANLIEL